MTLTPQDEEALLRVLKRYRELEAEEARKKQEAEEARKKHEEEYRAEARAWISAQIAKRSRLGGWLFFWRAYIADSEHRFREFREKHS